MLNMYIVSIPLDLDECRWVPDRACANGGTCVDENDGFICVCSTGFSGDRCEISGMN